jgi:hypothetical protein
MTHPTLVAALAALLVLVDPHPAAAAGRSDGLAAPERVLREVSGRDAADTSARRYATLALLQAATRRVATRDGSKAGPEDVARYNEYGKAMQSLLQDAARGGAPDCRGDACPAAQLRRAAAELTRQPDFVRAAFERFASPAWRAEYMNAAPGRPAAQAVAPAGAAGTTAAAAAPPPPAPTAGAPEPTRPVHTAGGVDMTVFGVPMGEPLRLPRCAAGSPQQQGMQALGSLFGVSEGPPTTCQSSSGAAALLGGDSGIGIHLPRARCPAWIHLTQGCALSGVMHNGRLAMVLIVTAGLDADEQIAQDLREKYGKPTSVRRATWSNRQGGRWEVEELTWDLKELYVEYRPMGKLDDAGSISIVTAEGRRFLDTEKKRVDAKRPKL